MPNESELLEMLEHSGKVTEIKFDVEQKSGDHTEKVYRVMYKVDEFTIEPRTVVIAVYPETDDAFFMRWNPLPEKTEFRSRVTRFIAEQDLRSRGILWHRLTAVDERAKRAIIEAIKETEDSAKAICVFYIAFEDDEGNLQFKEVTNWPG